MRKFWVSAPDALRGSLRTDPMLYVAAWFRLLCLCAESPVWGVVCLNEREGYPIDLLATELGFMHEFKDYSKAINETQNFLNYQRQKGRIEVIDWGGIRIVNWDKYQSGAYARKRRQREKEKAARIRNKEQDSNTSVTTVTLTRDDCHASTQDPVTSGTPARDNPSRNRTKKRESLKETPWNKETLTLEKEVTSPPTTLAQLNASRSNCAVTTPSATKDWRTLFQEQITEDKLDAIQKAFPSLDVRQEVNKMRAWLETHHDVAKRRKRFDLMLWRWVRNAQKRQDRLRGGNAKQRLQQHLQELKARGLIEDTAEYERAIKKITGTFVKALASLNPAIDAMEGEAYDRWFMEQMLEIALLDHQLSGALSTEDMLLVAEFLKQPECKFAVGDARDLRQKWLRILPQARKWWRKYHGGDL